MLIAPSGSTLAVALIAVVALMLGVVVAIAAQPRREAHVPAGGEPSAVPSPAYEAPPAAPAPAKRPEVSV